MLKIGHCQFCPQPAFPCMSSSITSHQRRAPWFTLLWMLPGMELLAFSQNQKVQGVRLRESTGQGCQNIPTDVTLVQLIDLSKHRKGDTRSRVDAVQAEMRGRGSIHDVKRGWTDQWSTRLGLAPLTSTTAGAMLPCCHGRQQLVTVVRVQEVQLSRPHGGHWPSSRVSRVGSSWWGVTEQNLADALFFA